MRWLMVLAMLVMPACGVGAAVAGEGAAPNDDLLQALVAEALERSEELAALRERAAAAEAMVRPAGALPDPMAMAGLSNVPVGSGVQLDEDMMSSVM
ncbi:MAG TPA: hypothetical protein VMY87_10055, partial [Armatimonadota bacterium]|nr:hypothetical protein [Armatimonadota bacterium]